MDGEPKATQEKGEGVSIPRQYFTYKFSLEGNRKVELHLGKEMVGPNSVLEHAGQIAAVFSDNTIRLEHLAIAMLRKHRDTFPELDESVNAFTAFNLLKARVQPAPTNLDESAEEAIGTLMFMTEDLCRIPYGRRNGMVQNRMASWWPAQSKQPTVFYPPLPLEYSEELIKFLVTAQQKSPDGMVTPQIVGSLLPTNDTVFYLFSPTGDKFHEKTRREPNL